MLKSRWCDIIVRNACAPTEDKIDDSGDCLHEVLEQALDYVQLYDIQIQIQEQIYIPRIPETVTRQLDVEHVVIHTNI